MPAWKVLSSLAQTSTIVADELLAELQLQPGVSLVLEKMALTAGAWSVTESSTTLASGDTLSLIMEQTPVSEAYAITARADGFTPGERLRAVMHSASSLPQSFETLELEMDFNRLYYGGKIELNKQKPGRYDHFES